MKSPEGKEHLQELEDKAAAGLHGPFHLPGGSRVWFLWSGLCSALTSLSVLLVFCRHPAPLVCGVLWNLFCELWIDEANPPPPCLLEFCRASISRRLDKHPHQCFVVSSWDTNGGSRSSDWKAFPKHCSGIELTLVGDVASSLPLRVHPGGMGSYLAKG